MEIGGHVQPRLIVESVSVYNQRVTIPMAHRIAHPGVQNVAPFWMLVRSVGVDDANAMRVFVQERHQPRLLDHLPGKRRVNGARNSWQMAMRLRIVGSVFE